MAQALLCLTSPIRAWLWCLGGLPRCVSGKESSPKLETRVRSVGGEDPLEKKWQPTPVCLPGESHGQRRLVGCSPWGCKKVRHTEQLNNKLVLLLTEWMRKGQEKGREEGGRTALRAVSSVLSSWNHHPVLNHPGTLYASSVWMSK